jgi:uncharacterized protein involved in high-affinity Fe2+ transport
MPVITGGFTVDLGWCEFLDSSGKINELFIAAVNEVVYQKIIDIEIAGTLSAAEKNMINLRNYVDRVIHFIKEESKYISRGQYMPWGDIRACIDNQWANILKHY